MPLPAPSPPAPLRLEVSAIERGGGEGGVRGKECGMRLAPLTPIPSPPHRDSDKRQVVAGGGEGRGISARGEGVQCLAELVAHKQSPAEVNSVRL